MRKKMNDFKLSIRIVFFRIYFTKGIAMVKQAPFPFSDDTEIAQPCQSITHFTTARPRPIPCSRREELPR
jgi:hypothetical protein